MSAASRTKRWAGSTSTPPLDESGAIICRRPASEGRGPRVSKDGQPWYYAYHDWFCANHPPAQYPALP